CSQSRITCFRDALFAIDRTALPGRRRQPRVGRDLSSVGKTPKERLHPKNGGEFGPNALDLKQHRHRRWLWRRRLRHSEQRVPLGLYRLDLLEQQFEPSEVPADLRLPMIL